MNLAFNEQVVTFIECIGVMLCLAVIIGFASVIIMTYLEGPDGVIKKEEHDE